jgi:hypothetical protein
MAPRRERSTPESGFPKSFDPYLRFAIATDFRTFESLDERFRLFFLAEFKASGLAREFERRMKEVELDVELGPHNEDSRFMTLRTGTAAVTEPRAFDIWNEFVSSLELSLPLMVSALPPDTPSTLRHRWNEGKDRASPGSVLIGVLDDGCPFAAAQFLKPPASTRVRGIWDQTSGKMPISVTDSSSTSRELGQVPTDFKYGLEFRRDFSGPPSMEMGLDEWIAWHSNAGTIDEDGCYKEAKFTRVAPRASHGAHVMDVLAGRVPPSSRIGPSPPGDRRDPPSWNLSTDIPSDSDIVFVQFSDGCIRDATGVWLKAYVFHGIQYILSFADPTNTAKVVINVSYGPTTGPHDGTAALEKALVDFVTEYNGATAGKPKLEVVLPAGNAYLSEGHIVYKRRKGQPSQVEWIWRLPPDNSVLCFAEIWIKRVKPGPVTVTLSSPSGATFTSITGPISPPPDKTLPLYTGVYKPTQRGSHTMWLLSVASTRDLAEHGDWRIQVAGIPENAQIHSFVARSDPNMGVRTGAKRSYFVDSEWEMTRSAQASCIYADGVFDATGSLIRRDGTLNGIATGTDSNVHVAGGYVRSNKRKSSYSSAGPARNGPLTLRKGPDYALFSDESYALRGVLAGGNRSGTVFRLIGTSAAAPQLARHVANSSIPAATEVPAVTDAEEIAKRGGGNIKPP